MNPNAALPSQDFLHNSGEMGRRIAAHDWSTTPLGPISDWPPSLRTTLSIMLGSRFAMCLGWGPELVLLYNDSYAPMLGAKDSNALGRPTQDVWSEVWDDVRPLVDSALAGEATWQEDMHLTMQRNGFPEDTWWTFSYAPVRDESGRVAGMLNIASDATSKVLNERRLTAERQQLARMFEQAPSFMALLTGPEHRFELVNPGYMRLIGERNVIGSTVAEVLPDAVRQGYLELLDRVYRTGEAHAATSAPYMVQVHPDSAIEEHYVDFVYQPIIDDEGRVSGVFVEGVDVTARTLGDLALRDREAQLSVLNANLEQEVVIRARERSRTWQVTTDLLAVVSAEGVIERTNPSWRHVLGWHDYELNDQPIAALVHPDDVTALQAVIAELQEGRPVLHFEYRFRTREGGYRELTWVATPEDGRYYCSARDVTELNLARQALAASQARMRTLFETSYQLQGMCQLDGTLVDANQTALDAIAATLDAVVGQPLWNTPWFSATPGASAVIQQDFRQALTGATVRREVDLMVASGPRSYDLSLRPIRDPSGAIVAIVPEAIDVTEQRSIEDALRQARKLEAMGQLTGGVAHDFNNLLTPIVVALELAETPDVNPERTRRMLAVARQAADRAATLVQRLLAFARRQPLQAGDVNVETLLVGMADLVASSCDPRITVALNIQPKLSHAVADANQLEMAILNLSVNARDAMPEGGTLTLSARNRRAPLAGNELPRGDYVVLSVCDTGHGMDQTTRQRAIEPFFSTRGVGKGTGLGLSMVHGLAQQLRGQLVIESAPGEGTTMELWLPVHGDATQSNQEDTTLNTTGDTKGIALVVDDEDGVRMCTADVMLDMGYRVVEAASAEEALRELDDGLLPDVLVTDHLMPGMTGSELARTVKIRLPAIAVVVVSGYANVDNIDSSLTVLSKPFRQSDMIASVQAATASAGHHAI